jgi:excisionase family DNA binding protein
MTTGSLGHMSWSLTTDTQQVHSAIDGQSAWILAIHGRQVWLGWRGPEAGTGHALGIRPGALPRIPASPTAPPPTGQLLLSVAEAAAVLGVSRRTAYRLVDAGVLRAGVAPGMGTRMISRQEIDRYLARHADPRRRR